jgi:glycosyltransferase involved in cell wall biosynthesis
VAERIGDVAAEAGLRRVQVVAWRDLDDPEAGGSEVHADTILSLWAQAGLDITMRTSAVPGGATEVTRNGYRVVRRAGRYLVFPRGAAATALGRQGPRDALVEIWNGMPFFSPLWAGRPRVVFCHHVHAEMWRMVLSPGLARLGEALEFRVAPPVYRRTRIVTLSNSSKRELVDDLGFRPDRVDVVPPGVDGRFRPGGAKSPDPLVVAVGRLVPVKRFDRLIRSLAAARVGRPDLRAVIVGEGYERPDLERLVRELDADDWIQLPGRLRDDELIELYQRAWVVASTSAREGWGMTLTEAAACGTPSVVSRIAGHSDAVADGVSGLLADDQEEMVGHLVRVLSDASYRAQLSDGALAHAARFSWEATALATMEVLADEATRHRRGASVASLRRRR